MFSTTVFKAVCPTVLLIFVSLMFTHQATHGQVVKTYSTGNLFGKKKKNAQTDKNTQTQPINCLTIETHGNNLYQDLYRCEGHIINLAEKDAIYPNAGAELYHSLKDAKSRLSEDLLIGQKIEKIHEGYQTCLQKGKTTISAGIMEWLLGTQEAYSKLISSTCKDLQTSVLRARKHMGLEGGIFADEVGDTNPKAARKEIDLGRKTMASLNSVCKEFPGLLEVHQTELDNLDKGYLEVEQAIEQTKNATYANDFHRQNLKTIAFAKQSISSRTSPDQFNATFTPQDDLFAACYLEKPMRDYISDSRITLPSFYLNFSIGGQAIAKMKVNSQPDPFVPFRILGQTAEAQQENGLIGLEKRKSLLKTLARLTPRTHPVLVTLTVGSSILAKGQFDLDCGGGDHKAHYDQLLADLDASDLEARRSRYLPALGFKHTFPSNSLRATVAKNLVAAGKGKIKRARIFIPKDKWTATVNGSGVVLYRRLYFEYILEATDGTFYAGENLIAEQALLGGGFETDLTPAFSPLDKNGNLKDLWEKNNGEFILWQIKVKPEVVEGRWK